MKAGVVVFPGSNCDRDIAVALEQATGKKTAMIWHRDTDLPDLDLTVVPGDSPTATICAAARWRRTRR